MSTVSNPGMQVLTWSQPVDTTAPDLIWTNGRPVAEGDPIRPKLIHKISKTTDERSKDMQQLTDRCWIIRYRYGGPLDNRRIRTIVDITTEPLDPLEPAPSGITAHIVADLADPDRTRYALQEIERFAQETGQLIDDETRDQLRDALDREPPNVIDKVKRLLPSKVARGAADEPEPTTSPTTCAVSN